MAAVFVFRLFIVRRKRVMGMFLLICFLAVVLAAYRVRFQEAVLAEKFLARL